MWKISSICIAQYPQIWNGTHCTRKSRSGILCWWKLDPDNRLRDYEEKWNQKKKKEYKPTEKYILQKEKKKKTEKDIKLFQA